MKFRLYNILLLALLCYSGSAFSQGEPLSLSEAISIGLERNFDIRIEKKNVEVAENNDAWGEAGLFPQLNAQLQGSHNVFDNKEAINPFQILGKTTTSQVVPSVNLNWNLLNLHGIIISKRRLEELQAESKGSADIVVVNNIQSIILGYYVAVLEQERLRVFSEQLTLSRDKYNIQEIRKGIGTSVTSDLLLEEGNYLSDSINFINQQLAYKNSISNLNFLLGEQDVERQYILSDKLIFENVDMSFDELSLMLESKNYDIKKQYLTQAVLGYDLAIQKASRYPQLNIGANYNLTRNRQDVTDWPLNRREIRDQDMNLIDVLEVGNNENVSYGANFTISFTLFNGGKINRAIERAKIQQDIGSIRIEKLKSSLSRDLKLAVDQYNIRKMLHAINERRYEASRQNLEISKEKYHNGTINSFDFRTVQNANLTASINRLQTLYDLIDSQITILRLTGGIIETYVE